jgi:beta-lactamase class A
MIKVLVLYELVRQCDRGAADWLERLTLRREDRTLGSGLLLDFSEGAALTLHDLAVLMMAISDNTATNMLIDRLGRGAINQACREAGLRVTELRGKVDFDRLRESNDNLGVTAPREFVRFIAAVRRGELIPEASAERMIGIMRIQKYIEPIRRLLPFSPYSVEFGDPCDVWVASKTGSLRGVRCEGGLVHTPRAEWTLCVMTKDSPDLRSSSDHAGVQFISRVSRAVFDAWS